MFESRRCHLNFSVVPVSSKEFLDIQATIEQESSNYMSCNWNWKVCIWDAKLQVNFWMFLNRWKLQSWMRAIFSLRTWSHSLKKSLMENFIFCVMYLPLLWSEMTMSEKEKPVRKMINNCETIGFMVSNCCEKKQTNTFGTLVIKEIMISQI